MIGWGDLVDALSVGDRLDPAAHVRVLVDEGSVITGRVRLLEKLAGLSWLLEVVDYRGNIHQVDCPVVDRVQVYGAQGMVTLGGSRPSSSPQIDPLRRVSRMLVALDSPRSRPYVHRRPDGRWQVTHLNAPVGEFYGGLVDAMRVAAGCVA